jgi:Ca2+-binding RTX toxin-like protein
MIVALLAIGLASATPPQITPAGTTISDAEASAEGKAAERATASKQVFRMSELADTSDLLPDGVVLEEAATTELCDQYNGHAVCGAIREKYRALGGPGGTLGSPTNSTTPLRDGGSFNHFSGGSIYFSPATGARTIRGAIRDKWASLGWENSYLGFPTTDDTSITGGKYSHFSGGSIYFSSATGAHTIHGPIGQLWTDLQTVEGFLGFPTSDAYAITSGSRQNFAGGQIIEDAATGAVSECTITGSDGPDQLNGTEAADIICGLDGNDVIEGLNGDDTIHAGKGDDTIRAGDGDDLVTGGAGTDRIEGDLGDDLLTGDEDHPLEGIGLEGADTILGGAGADEVSGNGGADTIQGGDENDTVFGGPGADTVNGDLGEDALQGEEGEDVLSGGEGTDHLAGGVDSDHLAGDAGNDSLTGDTGNDVLAGGDGDDTLTGGIGNDQLSGGIGQDELNGGPSPDTFDGGPDSDSCIMHRSATEDPSCETVHRNSPVDDEASYVTSLAPNPGQLIAPQITGPNLVTTSESMTVTAPINPDGAVQLSESDSTPLDESQPMLPELTVGLPSTGTQLPAAVAVDGSVVYQDSSGHVGITVQSDIEGSVRISTIIGSSDAPSEYRYPLTLPAEAHLELESNGGVAIMAADGAYLGGVMPPWAKDAVGSLVPTSYRIEGATIVQMVDLSGAAITYPVIADPTWGSCPTTGYGERSPSGAKKLVTDFKRRAQVASESGAKMPRGTSKLLCGHQLYDDKLSGSGYRHIKYRHSDEWAKKAVERHCCAWEYAADHAMRAILADPHSVTYRDANDTFCYSRRIYGWETTSNGRSYVSKVYFARVIISASTGNVIAAHVAKSLCDGSADLEITFPN